MIKVSQTNVEVKGISSKDLFYAKFENAGSEDLRVNGSVTPVTFDLPLPPTSEFLLERVTFAIGGDDIIDLSKFGSIAGLLNGVTFIANAGEDDEIETSIKNNGDIFLISTETNVSSVRFVAETKTIVYGSWDFTDSYGGNAPRIKDNKLQIIVNDDLTAMEYFKVSAHGIVYDNGN